MSKETIQAVVRELELLPETDRQSVLAFLAKLRASHVSSQEAVTPEGSALSRRDGLLVFTGQLQQPDTDWVRLVREERDADLTKAAFGPSDHR